MQGGVKCLVSDVVVKQRYILTAEGESEHEQGIDPEFPEISSYDCPECDTQLFTDEDEAIKFLRGG